MHVRASERCGIGAGRGRCATRHIRDVIALPRSIPNFSLPLILAPSRLSLLLRHLTASLSLSLFSLRSLYSLARSPAPVVPKLIPWNNWTPGNEPRIQHGQTGVAVHGVVERSVGRDRDARQDISIGNYEICAKVYKLTKNSNIQ